MAKCNQLTSLPFKGITRLTKNDEKNQNATDSEQNGDDDTTGHQLNSDIIMTSISEHIINDMSISIIQSDQYSCNDVILSSLSIIIIIICSSSQHTQCA